jgi:response regulator RpfG family c-di-GMP phosphodiesterase
MASAVTHTVLIVDDETEILESLRRTLRREPYRLILAASPEEAMRALRDGPVDVLVSDVDMPGMTGLELISHARRMHPEVVRILLTGAASMEGAINAINEGEGHRFLTKPWDKAELIETLRAAVERLDELRRGAAAAATLSMQSRLLRELERAYPGISKVPEADETYRVDRAKLAEAVSLVDSPEVRDLFSTIASAPTNEGGSSEREGDGVRQRREAVAQAQTLVAAQTPGRKVEGH